MPEAVIIGQDEGTEIRVQALVQSGRRRVDLRVWRRGPSGFAPSRSGLVLNVADLDALRESIAELLGASNGGTEAARIIWHDDGRRLNAEIAPFGAHHVARFAFWQRARNTWHAVDDGLVVSADRLPFLRQTLLRFRPWLAVPDGEGQNLVELGCEGSGYWPSPGADWLTAGPAQVAFHPRSIRITAAVVRAGDGVRIKINQWQRDESLWVPRDRAVVLSESGIEALLVALEALDRDRGPETAGCRDIVIDDTALRLHYAPEGDFFLERQAGDAESFEDVLLFPAEYLPRFGRFLLQSWSLLADRLAEASWADLDAEPADPAGVPGGDDAPVTNEDMAAAPETALELPDDDEPEPVEIVSLGDATVGEHHLVFSRHGTDPGDTFFVEWDERSLEIPTRYCAEIVAGVRTLYYDALVGRRHMLVREDAGIRVGVHSQGPTLALVVEQGRDGEACALTIPGSAVPVFLDAVETALSHL